MRHVVHITDKRTEQALAKFMAEYEKTAKIVDSFDPIERLAVEVEKIGTSLRELKQNGVTWDLFYTYLRGRQIPAAHIDAVMEGVKAFFQTVGIKL